MIGMNPETLGSELKRYLIACGSDPDKLAAFEAYVLLLAARDESNDDGNGPAIREAYDAQISVARDELIYQLSDPKNGP